MRVDGRLPALREATGPQLVRAAGVEGIPREVQVVLVEPREVVVGRADLHQVERVPRTAERDRRVAEEHVDVRREVRLAWPALLGLLDEADDGCVLLGERRLVGEIGGRRRRGRRARPRRRARRGEARGSRGDDSVSASAARPIPNDGSRVRRCASSRSSATDRNSSRRRPYPRRFATRASRRSSSTPASTGTTSSRRSSSTSSGSPTRHIGSTSGRPTSRRLRLRSARSSSRSGPTWFSSSVTRTRRSRVRAPPRRPASRSRTSRPGSAAATSRCPRSDPGSRSIGWRRSSSAPTSGRPTSFAPKASGGESRWSAT